LTIIILAHLLTAIIDVLKKVCHEISKKLKQRKLESLKEIVIKNEIFTEGIEDLNKKPD